MKLTLTLLVSAAVALLFGACNQHSWDGEDGQPPVKEIFKTHGHGHGHDDHSKEEKHEKTEGGEEEKEKAE